MQELLAVRDARIYLAGQALSSLGDTVMWLAMGIWVKTLTGSNGAAGLVFFAFALPQLFAPLSGLLVDRLPRRSVLLVTNLAIGATVLALLGVHGRDQVWLVYVVMLGYGAAYTILSAGKTALLKELLPAELLGQANSLLQTTQEGFRLFGPLLGAGLFAAFGGATVAVLDAATFAGAAVSLALLRIRHENPLPRSDPWRVEVGAGFGHIRRTPALRRVVGACAVSFLVIGVIESAAFAVVAGLHRPPTFISVLTVAQGAGAIASGVSAAGIMRRIGEVALTATGLALFATGTALLSLPSLAVVITGAVILGASLPWMVIGPMTLVQRVTPQPLVGRVSAAADTLIGVPQTISIAVGAGLVSIIDYRLLLLLTAAVVAGSAADLLIRKARIGWRAASATNKPAATSTRGAGFAP